MRRTPLLTSPAVAALAVILALLAPPPAAARGGSDDEARVRAFCGQGATAELRLSARDGRIRVDFRVDSRQRGQRWRVLLVHERRVAWRSTLRAGSSSRSLRIRRSLPDYEGADQVTARASGSRGVTCQATAVLRSS